MDRKKDAFDKTLAGHVRKSMAAHKKVKKHGTHTSRRIPLTTGKDLPSILEAHEERKEERDEIHAMIGIGMDTLFPDVKQQIQALVIEDTEEGTNDTIRALTYKCNVRIMVMDVDDIEDLLYILDLLDGETGAWYWNRVQHQLRDSVSSRLNMFEAEEYDDE